jgi:hypothetical protein
MQRGNEAGNGIFVGNLKDFGETRLGFRVKAAKEREMDLWD